jgi:hypothetical protein
VPVATGWRMRRGTARGLRGYVAGKMDQGGEREHAHLNARLAAFRSRPEAIARLRLNELRRRKRAFLASSGPPLSLAEEAQLRGLTILYPMLRSVVLNSIMTMNQLSTIQHSTGSWSWC